MPPSPSRVLGGSLLGVLRPREVLERPAVAKVHPFESLIDLAAARVIVHGGYDEHSAIGTDVERSVSVDAQKVQYRAIDDQRQALPCLTSLRITAVGPPAG